MTAPVAQPASRRRDAVPARPQLPGL